MRPVRPVRPALPVRRSGASPLVAAAIAALLGALLYAAPYVVAHGSMAPTLAPGDLLLVDRVTPAATGYRRGDLVVFRPPPAANRPESPVYVKRIVALPSEHVQIRRGAVFVDGARLDEPYLDVPPAATGSADTDVVVPAGAVFVLGDNRGPSVDSRQFGPVPTGSIVGRVWGVVGHMPRLLAIGRPSQASQGPAAIRP